MPTMKKFFITIFGALLFSACLSATAISTDEILDEMQKVYDPEGKCKTVKSSLMKISITIPAQKIKMSCVQKFKEPNRQISLTEIPGVLQITQVFDGKSGWETSSVAGVRLITGKELDFLKFNTATSSIKNMPKDIFSKFELREDALVNGAECYQLIMTPKEDFNCEPVKLFVDKKTFLTKKIEMTIVSAQGEFPSVAVMENHKVFNGLLIPDKVSTESVGTKMIQTLEMIELNVEIDDSEFKMPDSLSATNEPAKQ